MRHGSLFSGIGGFDLASEWMGWENVFHCEWNTFGQKVLNYYWPNSITYNDITKTDFTIHRGGIDIITGGFPCQPYSSAGKRLGKEDERHLWPEMLRAIREIQPSWVVGENVRGLTNWNGGLVFDEVQADLEAQGYQVTPFLLPACAVNAPHRRDRIWFIAYSKSNDAKRIREFNNNKWENNKEKWSGFWNEFTSNGSESNASNSDLLRCDQRIQYDEVNTGEGRIDAFSHIYKSDGNGDASDSSSIGFCEHSSRKELFSETFGTQLGMDKQNATDSESKRFQGMHKTRRKDINNRKNTEIRRNIARYDKKSNWKNFPTVPPICDGDDGLSDRLDSITFSKWRQESIKAGGNAIVPQVVYQIFKAIEQYETT
jgi:DNA (cytosine-5)-methyltransferase 1